MQLFLLSPDACRFLALPDLPEGRFVFMDEQQRQPWLTVLGTEAGWRLSPVPPCAAAGEAEPLLRVHAPVTLRVGPQQQKRLLYPAPGDAASRSFARCPAPDSMTLTVGSAPDNELICRQPYMNAHHLVLECRHRVWTARCLDSSYGMYVNGRRCQQQTLRPGDVLSVLEQKLIVLPGLLAFNAPDGQTALRAGSSLQPLQPPRITLEQAFTSTPLEDFFYRAPRFSTGLESQSLTVDSPPAPHEPSQTNALLTMAPGLLTGVVSLAITTNPLLPLASLAGATIFPFINRRNAEKQQAEDEEKRKAAYKAYLDDIEKHIADVTARQESALRKRNPPTTERLAALEHARHRLWNRNSLQADYLELRLGTGEIPLQYDITFPQDHFEQQSDPMKQLMRELRDRERTLKDVPVVLPLSRFRCLGVAAPREARTALAANLLTQLAIDYGYDEMKICLIGSSMPALDVYTWLPHTWDNSRRNHLVARTPDEMQRLLPILDGMLASRAVERNKEPILEPGEAELVIFLMDDDIAQSGVVSRLLLDRAYRGVRVVALSEHSRRLPRRCDAVISIHQGEGRMIWQEESGSRMLTFTPEDSALGEGSRLVSTLANLYLDLPDTASRIPESVPFLELFGVQDVHALNVLTRWQRNNPANSLAVPIGIDEDGSLCCLDVHERGDGQHGLIAGMTGSGKSELIMTYILSAAVCFSPEEIAFLLIDYKGGGMAQAFEQLPHTAGIITNLDGNAVGRSLQAIQSELVRRQAIFHQTEQALDMTGMNIIKYQRLYREKRVSQPLPHLLIITDEFAELKSQEPDFMQQLISASRIGRSLGVHLILATQKPSGVVDEQIWSNTNWRICLRVQDARDSQDVIKCPDAAALPGVGRFYLQVGYGMLRQAQSGFTGAPYLPNRHTGVSCGVDVLDASGHVLSHSELPRSGSKGRTEYQISAVVAYLKQVADMQHLRCQPIWLPPLERVISLSALRRKYAAEDSPWMLSPVVGEIDDPATQSRRLLRCSLSEGKNVMVYGGVGSGKAMFLAAALEDLLLRHGPREMHLYILDYADEGLGVYRDAPQVGDVLSPAEDEKLTNLLRMLMQEVERRRTALAGSMGSEALPERLARAGLPHILVIGHHIHVLKEKLSDDLAPLTRLLRDGPRYGVSFLGTTTAPGQIGFKLQESFPQSYVLQLDRSDDYSLLLGRTGGFHPEAVRGRGMIRLDNLCEYQTATADSDPEELCRQLVAQYPGQKAPEVRVLPDRVTADSLRTFLRPEELWTVPVGLDCVTLAPVMLEMKKRFVHLFLAGEEDAAAFVGECLPLLPSGPRVTVWGSDMIAGKPIEGVRYVPLSESAAFLEELFGEMNAVAIAMQRHEPLPEVTEKLILMPACTKVLDLLKATGDGLPFTRLSSYLARLKPLYRCTFLLFSPAQAWKAYQYDEWFKLQVSSSDGMALGRGLSSQYILTAGNALALTRQEAAFPFGFDIRGGTGRRVKFLADRLIQEGGL
ncbi:MAG: type VII secretion protein EssC [Aristaeellaceae bacterium]